MPALGFVGLMRAKVLYERNDLGAAERHAREGLDLVRQGRIALGQETLYGVLARVLQAQGDADGAAAALERALQVARGNDIPRLVIQTQAYRARIWLALGDVERAARWARDYRQLDETEYLREFEDLTLARALLPRARRARGEPTEALALLDALLPPAEAAGRVGTVIDALAVRALALHASDRMGPALGDLQRALELAEPGGYVRVFVDEGEPMAKLLSQVAGAMAGYASELLAAFAAPMHKPPGPGPEPLQPEALIEPLTPRELQVLGLLAEGLTNPEIARRLVISLPTVKSHTRNLYAKLGVHSRREAVARARRLGILPSPGSGA